MLNWELGSECLPEQERALRWLVKINTVKELKIPPEATGWVLGVQAQAVENWHNLHPTTLRYGKPAHIISYRKIATRKKVKHVRLGKTENKLTLSIKNFKKEEWREIHHYSRITWSLSKTHIPLHSHHTWLRLSKPKGPIRFEEIKADSVHHVLGCAWWWWRRWNYLLQHWEVRSHKLMKMVCSMQPGQF